MAQEPTVNAHWRDSARTAKFFFIDAKAAFPILLFLMHIRMWTFVIAVAFMVFFTLIKRFGYTLEVFMRIFRGFMSGPRKMAIPWWRN